MSELTCIVCPIGCTISIENNPKDGSDSVTITGNSCPRGAAFAQEELFSPKRVVTATCGILALNEASGSAIRRIPLKTSAPCPKEKISELLGDIYKLKLKLPVKAGDKPIVNWKDSGFDVVVVRDIEV